MISETFIHFNIAHEGLKKKETRKDVEFKFKILYLYDYDNDDCNLWFEV